MFEQVQFQQYSHGNVVGSGNAVNCRLRRYGVCREGGGFGAKDFMLACTHAHSYTSTFTRTQARADVEEWSKQVPATVQGKFVASIAIIIGIITLAGPGPIVLACFGICFGMFWHLCVANVLLMCWHVLASMCC